VSCNADPIMINGQPYEPIRYGHERKVGRWVPPDMCHDCNVPLGGVHHPGCDVERCPACLGQALGCPCFDEPECEPFSSRRRCTVHFFRRQRMR
jgi:hypothetical protein